MTHKDLMIGNFILCNGQVVEVLNFDETGINWTFGYMPGSGDGLDYDYMWESDAIEGIELSPEWFDKLGFEFNKGRITSREYWVFGDLGVELQSSGQYYVWVGHDETYHPLIGDYKYVHEIQNLMKWVASPQ